MPRLVKLLNLFAGITGSGEFWEGEKERGIPRSARSK